MELNLKGGMSVVRTRKPHPIIDLHSQSAKQDDGGGGRYMYNISIHAGTEVCATLRFPFRRISMLTTIPQCLKLSARVAQTDHVRKHARYHVVQRINMA